MASPYPEDTPLIEASLKDESAAVKDYTERAKVAKCPKLKAYFRGIARDEMGHVKELKSRVSCPRRLM